MKRANAVGFVQAITSGILILLLVYQQADCDELLQHQNVAYLTTYGNQQVAFNPNSTTKNKPISSRECKSDTDCAGIPVSVCTRHPNDNKLQCLCPDKSLPWDGACYHSRQGLHQTCHEDVDCIKNALCKDDDAADVRTCECAEGYKEEDYACSSSPLTRVPSTQAVFLLLFYPFLLLVK